MVGEGAVGHIWYVTFLDASMFVTLSQSGVSHSWITLDCSFISLNDPVAKNQRHAIGPLSSVSGDANSLTSLLFSTSCLHLPLDTGRQIGL